MKISKLLILLCLLVAGLGGVAAASGLFWQAGDGAYDFTTQHGQTVQIYGQGLYRNDTAFKAPVYRGTDAVVLSLVLPVFLVSLWLYWRGSLRGGLLLCGGLTIFLYNAASLAFGAAYNDLFLIYLIYFSSSLFALIYALTLIDYAGLPARINPHLPHAWIAGFIFFAGLSPLVWLIEIISAQASGSIPNSLMSYTTETTALLDGAIIFPTCYLAGILLLRRKPLGYVLSAVLLTLLVLIGFVVVGQTVVQMASGIVLSSRETAMFVAPFVILGLIAIGFLTTLLKQVREV